MNRQDICRGACLGLLVGVLGSCGLLPTLGDGASLPLVDMSELPPCVADDCNCGDFRDRALAQRVLAALPDDPFRLDSDGNGLACETLPVESAIPYTAGTASSVHLGLGNPTNAQGDDRRNFLLERSQYALSYNSDRGTANWVSWQLNADWLGNTERQDNFRQDGGLPAGVYQVTPNDYRNTGYDRGHIVPSGDRTRSVSDNSATFLMTNILPQAPQNNRGVWRELEEYSRDLVYQYDWTLYVMAGGYGEQDRLAAGRVTVPSRLWKIIVAIAPGETIADIDATTPIIAVDMPNRDTAIADWRVYQTTVDRVELATGYDFLSTVPLEIQAILEATQLNTASAMPQP
ncbi:DNA/RNA non-specific endonuclease [Halomicronema sp. CCY15110]|uniref:DNA/RNA non-specific endonuclease n=1 Tax=Halomicronema sp. CCY15110 TaxID=2767773 RepID=UPI0019522A99|nr:DNA/RNA non-specific endonuclease [Halomicronema sp. CCY15110]